MAQQKVSAAVIERRERVRVCVERGLTVLEIVRIEYEEGANFDAHRQRIYDDIRRLGIADRAHGRPEGSGGRPEGSGGAWGPPDVNGICEHLTCHWKGCAGCNYEGGRRVPVTRVAARAEDYVRTGNSLTWAVTE
jgi:hypothetical protein